ncbi:hypothetical protein F5Y05DRAFT_411134 [Hypoxylon sp. FL0543]|nr:hypothetical protein F5Y05DRAFT_411134 [Hypoxylon sp. FL0543]
MVPFVVVSTQMLDQDFVRIAFESARKADQYAKLWINDCHLESSISANANLSDFKYVKRSSPLAPSEFDIVNSPANEYFKAEKSSSRF